MTKRSDIKPTKLGLYIKQRRADLGLMAKEVADRAGLPGSAITRIESGEHTHPSPPTLKAIAKALDIPLIDLLAEAGVVPKGELPSLNTYLKAKYDLTDATAREVEAFFRQIGITRNRSADGTTNEDSNHRHTA
ncbi:helix-turn-helix domain-containing protein [Nocardia sp. CA-135953]|uniref:helix-turn-helix domain-containing protein n=1 Tax=Nocardia sp. CA-135953 TaxID=3239978 RepID=UPI003D97CAFF